jgi:hypothetical protein
MPAQEGGNNVDDEGWVTEGARVEGSVDARLPNCGHGGKRTPKPEQDRFQLVCAMDAVPISVAKPRGGQRRNNRDASPEHTTHICAHLM